VSEEHPNRSDYDVTGLLHAWGRGELGARDQLMLVVYEELRRRAAARLRREGRGHVLQPTALVHEAYLRLVNQRHADWQNRAHFFAVASEMMRRILVDHARRRKMVKRSGGWARVTVDDAVAQSDPPDVDLLDLDVALSELASFDARKSRVAELRFFGGLSLDEIAHALGASRATIEREWQAARAWLYRRMTHSPDDPHS
jgi:RNA polymerase sigma factor (TIGR02999 family)